MTNKVTLPEPTLILLAGISATGKTTTGKPVARAIYDTLYVDKDIVNETFLMTPDPADSGIDTYRLSGSKLLRSTEHYKRNVGLQSYQLMLELARDNIIDGKHPILDGNYTKEIRRGYIERVVNPFFANVDHRTKLIFCYADEQTIRDRIRKRAALERDTDKMTDEGWQKLMQEQPILPPELEKYDHVKIDTTRPVAECVQRSIDYLMA